MRGFTRRAALLGGASLLAGCDSITDTFDRWFGEKKVPLTGDRQAVLSTDKPFGADPKDRIPVTLPPAVPNADWPQVGGGISHVAGNPALGAGLRPIWAVGVGTAAEYRRRLLAPPIVAANIVYAMDSLGLVTALDATTGARRWAFDTRKPKERGGALSGGLALDSGTLYVTTGFAEAMALDAATGQVGWRVSIAAPGRGSPTVAAGRLLFPTIDNRVVSLSAADGKEQWSYKGQPTTTMVLGLPAPAVQGDTVVAGLASGEIVALRIGDGRMIWSEALSSVRGGGLADITAVTALPVIDNGRVIGAGLGGIMIALDLRSGRRLWEREVTLAETPWVAGDWLFVVTTAADLACLGVADGKVRWLTPLAKYENPEKKRDLITWGAPTVAGGRLLIGGSHGALVEVNVADGTVTGQMKLSDGMTLAPAIAGGTLYVLTNDARLTAFRGA